MCFVNYALLGLVGLVLIGSPPWTTDAFNVETRHYAVYRRELKSMFGFAVTSYRDRNGRGWAIVGAPEAQTPQVGVYRGGAVFRCDIAADDRCTMIHFDDKGHNHVRNPSVVGGLSQIDNKTLQWFGATVSASTKQGGPILACAPRYIWFSVSQQKYDPDDGRWSKESSVGNRREPVGTCWVVSNDFAESQEYSPCRTKYWGYHRQGSCQAGLGASMSKNGERLFIGAPGSWYWQGQIYSINTTTRFKYVATMSFVSEEDPGQAFSQPLNSRSKIMFTKEGPAKEDDSYMGYSVTTGDFVGNGDNGTAVGVPRGSDLLGKVILFTSNMTNPRNITGEQMGAYFGYAVASGDINGDGLDDLIVGAPMYTEPDNPEMKIETGRIYVIYQGAGPEKFRELDTRDGESNRGRFGLSLSSLGDIDRDGCGDFVVGAPYAGPNGRGAVYIYHGSRDGVLKKYSQVIYAEDLDVAVSTFGFSVAGGLDLDGNSYPDLVVGAYDSSAAMFFRSRPVIKMDSFVSFDLESKLISLDHRDCVLSKGDNVTCVPLRACFSYTGEGVLPRHNFNIQYVLDVKKTKNPRLFFLENEGRNTMNHTITVDRDSQFCRTVKVYVSPNIRDKLTPLNAELRMSLEEEQIPDRSPRDPRVPLRPVLGTTTSRKDSLSIRKNCGEDDVCVPDLWLTVQANVEQYLLGSGKRLELDVLVQNMGEDAFEATFNLKLPSGIDYINIEKFEVQDRPVQCSAPKQSTGNTLRCDIGNPLPQNKLVKFKVLLQPVTTHDMKPIYEFYMEANTTNPENPQTTNDNRYTLVLPIWVETDLRVDGESRPKELYYNPDNYTVVNASTELEFGPAVMHNYTIRNQGPLDIIEAEAFLIWPAQTLAGNELLYLLEQPETSGPITCQSANANYLSLKLEERRKSYYMHYREHSAVILDESRSGHAINVQRGLTREQNNGSQEEHEIARETSSSRQNSQHSGSSSSASVSGTSRIQLTPNEGKSVITKTYTENSSSTSSVHVGGVSNSNGVVIETGSGTTTLGGIFHPTSEESSLGTRISHVEGQHETRSNRSRVVIPHDPEGLVNPLDTERQLHEQQDRLAKAQEEDRLDEIKRQEERRRDQERVYKEERRRRPEVEERERHYNREKEFVYGGQTRQGGSTGTLITGDREETVKSGEFGISLHNITSPRELEKLFGSISKEASGYEVYNRQGVPYVQFMGRFRTFADRKEYIEFQDGSMFPLQGRYGEQSYASERYESRSSRFLRMEGRLFISSDDRGYIVLKDGRRFPLQGSYTYTKERTHNLAGEHGGSVQGGRGANDRDSRTYESSWREESSSNSGDPAGDYESKYSSRVHKEHRTEDRKVSSRVYGETRSTVYAGDHITEQPDPNLINSRFRRESDMVEVKEFRNFEKHHRHRRDLDNDPSDAQFNDDYGIDELSSPQVRELIKLCDDVAKCVVLRCVLGPLKKDEEVSIGARYRVDARTLKKVAFKEKVKVSTKLMARVTKQPFIGTPAEPVIRSEEVVTNVEPSAPPSAPDIIPLWVVVLSACAGTIILLLLIFLLHKCGFFKRNRPSDAPERQPLNRNGHYQHGDDH